MDTREEGSHVKRQGYIGTYPGTASTMPNVVVRQFQRQQLSPTVAMCLHLTQI